MRSRPQFLATTGLQTMDHGPGFTSGSGWNISNSDEVPTGRGGGEETGGPTTLLLQLSNFFFFSFDYSDNNVTDDIKQGSIITYQLVV